VIDTLVYDAAGRGGRIAVVTRLEGYASGGGWIAPTAWVFLVVVDGKFEEWRAGDCTTVRPATLPVPTAPIPPPTRGHVHTVGQCADCDRAR
jgi:hypothetical protein